MRKTILLTIILIILSSLSYLVFSQTEGEFEIGNEAPYIASFAVQDSATNWDSSALDTHDITPSFRWKVNDVNPDILTTTICIGSTSGACDVLTETSLGTYNSGDTATYDYAGSDISFNQLTDCSISACSKTLYVTVNLNDGQGGLDSKIYSVVFLNSVPNTPSALTPTTTHSQTPDLTWTAIDTDDGTENKWPADVLTYHIQIGALSPGNEDYLADPLASSASVTSTDYTAPIPWGVAGLTQAINTVQVRIWSTDNLGINSANYDTTLDLIDNLPEFLDIYMSDIPIDDTHSCTQFLQPCLISPTKGTYTSVNIKLKTRDIDADCSALTHSSAVVLCMVDSEGVEICDSANNADYFYDLAFLQIMGDVCEFTISIPLSDSRGIEFFKAPGTYKLYTNSSSQAGISTQPWNYKWEYDSLPAPEYPSTVYLGDRAIDGGDGIQLGNWNPGLSLAKMINYGNIILNLDWKATDPKPDTYTCTETSPNCCSGATATYPECWDLTNYPNQFQLDDDNLQGEATETGLTPVNIPEDPATIIFQPSGGLQVCNVMTCDAGINEFLNTYFHIQPPVGLSPGTYKTTINYRTT